MQPFIYILFSDIFVIVFDKKERISSSLLIGISYQMLFNASANESTSTFLIFMTT